MIVFQSAKHKNRISVPQKNINKKRQMVSPTHPVLKHFFLCSSATLGGWPFFGRMLHFSLSFTQPAKPSTFFFSFKDRRYARFDKRMF